MDKLDSGAKAHSRRRFIKRSAAGLAISSLPAQSVWGACNASGISGGSRVVNMTCSVPTSSGGWSPGTWDKFLKDDVSGQFPSNATTKFDNVFGSGVAMCQEEYDAYLEALNTLYETTVLTMGDGSIIESHSFSIADAFDGTVTGKSVKDFAALYLNAYFGMNSFDTTLYPTAHDYVAAMWAALAVNHGVKSFGGTYMLNSEQGMIVATYTEESSAPGNYGLLNVTQNCPP